MPQGTGYQVTQMKKAFKASLSKKPKRGLRKVRRSMKASLSSGMASARRAIKRT